MARISDSSSGLLGQADSAQEDAAADRSAGARPGCTLEGTRRAQTKGESGASSADVHHRALLHPGQGLTGSEITEIGLFLAADHVNRQPCLCPHLFNKERRIRCFPGGAGGHRPNLVNPMKVQQAAEFLQCLQGAGNSLWLQALPPGHPLSQAAHPQCPELGLQLPVVQPGDQQPH